MAIIVLNGDSSLVGQQLPSSPNTDFSEPGRTIGYPYINTKGYIGAPVANLILTYVEAQPTPKKVVLLAKAPSYVDDYYNRIIVNPSFVDVGNMTADQIFKVEVWNGFFDSKTLQQINSIDAGGIILQGPVPPAEWEALQTRTYQMSISVDGPPEINAQLQFDFLTVPYKPDIRIVGSRIVALNIPFEAPAMETLTWMSQVIVANDGTEQRVRLRKAPRTNFECMYPIPQSEMRQVQNRVYGWYPRRWAVPLWSEAQYVGDIASGATSVTLPSMYTDMRADTNIYIYQSNAINTSVEILSVVGNVVTFKKPLPQAFLRAYVMPVRIGRITTNANRATSGFNAKLQMEYEISDNIDLGAGTAPPQFLGEDIYFNPSLFGADGTVEDQLYARVDTVDYETGTTASFSPWKYMHTRRPFRYVLQGLQEIWEFRQWLHRRAGRVKPFWIPTFESDLRLIYTGQIINVFNVAEDDYALFAGKRNHIAIQLQDGSWITRTIVSASTIGNGLTNIVVDTALNMNASNIKMISFLGLKRLDSDRIELEWGNNRTVQTTIPVVELNP